MKLQIIAFLSILYDLTLSNFKYLFQSFAGFESIENKGNFPYPYFFCVVGILIPLFVEKIWYKHDHSQMSSILTESTSGEGGAKKMLSTLMLVVTLSVHALIEGMRH